MPIDFREVPDRGAKIWRDAIRPAKGPAGEFGQRVARRLSVLIFVTSLTLGLAGAAAAQEADPNEEVSYPGCPLLLEGQTSACVERLQADLKAINDTYIPRVTGFFGPQTRTAVLDFQGRNKLPADGNVGKTTADELTRQAGSERQAPASTCSEGDRDESKRLADEGGLTERKATAGSIEVTLRYSQQYRCYWSLLNGFTRINTVSVWLERRPRGGDESSVERLRQHTTTWGTSTYSAPFSKTEDQEIRACSQTLTPDLTGGGGRRSSGEGAPDVLDLCTGWE